MSDLLSAKNSERDSDPTYQHSQTAVASCSAWYILFEVLKTILWFSRAWVAKPCGWIVDNKFEKGVQPDWGVNIFQYLFLPLLPFVTFGLSMALAYTTLIFLGDIYLAAGVLTFSYVYASGGIHMDGYVDTIDAAACHDKDKWRVMKEPLIGGLGAYNLNLYQITFMAALFYASVKILEAPHLLLYLVLAFSIARINCLYLLSYYNEKGKFRQDEVVNLAPPYFTKELSKLYNVRAKYLTGILIAASSIFLMAAWNLPSMPKMVVFAAVSGAVMFCINKVLVSGIVKNLGFISGDVFGFMITSAELALTISFLALSARHILA